MSAYWISIYNEILDEDKMAAYAQLARPALEGAGGTFIARGLPEQTYESGEATRIVLIEFESVEAARAAHDSPGLPGGARRPRRWSRPRHTHRPRRLSPAPDRNPCVLFAEVVAASAAVTATRSRTAKTAVLAELLARAGDGIEPVTAWLSGEPRQGRIGIGWRRLGAQTTTPAAEPTLTVDDVDRTLTELAAMTGPGSSGRRADRLGQLFSAATADEQRFLSACSPARCARAHWRPSCSTRSQRPPTCRPPRPGGRSCSPAACRSPPPWR